MQSISWSWSQVYTLRVDIDITKRQFENEPDGSDTVKMCVLSYLNDDVCGCLRFLCQFKVP